MTEIPHLPEMADVELQFSELYQIKFKKKTNLDNGKHKINRL